jgi:hypothetical protein
LATIERLPATHLQVVRVFIILFIVGLTLSGLSAIPIPWGARLLEAWLGPDTWMARLWPALGIWIGTVARGVGAAVAGYPFLFYGTDWLAFGHIVIALAFLGPLRDPVRYHWIVEWGIIACVLVIPWAMIFGAARGIPFFWRVIDCSFGLGGLVLLLPTYALIRREMHAAP